MARYVSIRVDGLEAARASVDGVGERANNSGPGLESRSVLVALQSAERRRFSRRWKPTTRKWAKQKRREGLDPRRMRATGALYQLLTNASPPTVRFEARGDVLTFGVPSRSKAWYAVVQKKRGRNAVVIDKTGRADVAKVIHAYIVNDGPYG